MTNMDCNWPIEEAVCLIRFKPSKEWDLTAFGKFYSRIEDEYPTKEEMIILEDALDDDREEIDSGFCEEEKLMRFTSRGGTEIVQLSRNMLIVNQLPPYPRWEKFRPIVLNRIIDFCESFNPVSIEYIGLRYINKFEKPKDEFEITSVLSDNDYVPRIIFQKKSQFMLNLNYTNGEDFTTEINTGFVESGKDDIIAIILDIEVSNSNDFPVDIEFLSAKLDEYYNRTNTIFKGCICDDLKKDYGIIEEQL